MVRILGIARVFERPVSQAAYHRDRFLQPLFVHQQVQVRHAAGQVGRICDLIQRRALEKHGRHAGVRECRRDGPELAAGDQRRGELLPGDIAEERRCRGRDPMLCPRQRMRDHCSHAVRARQLGDPLPVRHAARGRDVAQPPGCHSDGLDQQALFR